MSHLKTIADNYRVKISLGVKLGSSRHNFNKKSQKTLITKFQSPHTTQTIMKSFLLTTFTAFFTFFTFFTFFPFSSATITIEPQTETTIKILKQAHLLSNTTVCLSVTADDTVFYSKDDYEVYRDIKNDKDTGGLSLNLTKLYLGIPRTEGARFPEFLYASPSTRLDRIYVLDMEAVVGNGGKENGGKENGGKGGFWGESEALSDDDSIIFVFSDEANVEWFFCENK